MTVLRIEDAPPAELARRLARFEAQFRYPLGPGRTFRIEHGDDYTRFFRAMGPAASFVDEDEGRIRGVISVALRRLVQPDGSERVSAYVGDLKVDPASRNGRSLVRLAQAARGWAAPRASGAYAVVMGGTRVSPERYTGRLGIPRFEALHELAVLRFATSGAGETAPEGWEADAARGEACRALLDLGRNACRGGDPALRSELAPLWLVAPGGRACGRLEDTRRAKRLVADDGVEMRSAHLSCCAWTNLAALAELVSVACRAAAERGSPALFVAVPADLGEPLRRAVASEAVLAPATVYGTGFEPGAPWSIDTAEI